MSKASSGNVGNVLKSKILEFRNLTRDPYQRAHDNEYLKYVRTQEMSEFERAYMVSVKSTETTTPYLSKRMIEETAKECAFLKELRRKEVEDLLNKKNEQIEDKLGKFLDRQHFEEDRKLKRTAFLRHNDPDLKVYTNTMRSKSIGLIQRSQMIMRKLNEKKKLEEAREQELRYMNQCQKNEYQRQCDERVYNFKKKEEFAKAVREQLQEKRTIHCEDFEAERKRCDTVVAKELAEIQAEHDEALKKKNLLREFFMKDLGQRCRGLYDEQEESIELDRRTALEMKELDAKRDAEVNRIQQNAEKIATKQMKAGVYLEALENKIANSLEKRALYASNELEIEKKNLDSSMEWDEIFAEPFKKTLMQAAVKADLDKLDEIRRKKILKEKEDDKLASKIYLDAVAKELAEQDHKNNLRRQAGLESGECLKSQIEIKKKELEKAKELELENAKKSHKERMALAQEIEVEKELLAKEFARWESNLIMPESKPIDVCENRLEQATLITKNTIVPWITEVQENYGTWQPEKPYHPLVIKKNI